MPDQYSATAVRATPRPAARGRPLGLVVGLVVGLVLAVGPGLAGCADVPPAPTASPAVDPGRADVDFAAAMVPHHEQALELAALVAGRSSAPEVADLAFRIDREQVEEIGQLRGFLRLRDATPAPAHDTAGTAGMAGMAGMADGAVLERLRAASGPAFDRLWLETMTTHHEGALAMAREYLASTRGAGALGEFARTLLVTQQGEIDRMGAAYR